MNAPPPPSQRGRFSWLRKGAKWLAAVLIVAIVGVLANLLIPPLFGPEELAAELSDVSIDPAVTLEAFALRHESTSARESRQTAGIGSGVVMLLASAGRVAQAPPATTTEPTTSPPPTTPTQTTPEPTTPERPAGEGPPAVPMTPSMMDRVDRAVQKAIDAPGVPSLDALPRACQEDAVLPGCGLGDVVTGGDLVDKRVSTIAAELAKVFRGTRTVRAMSDPSKRELVGVAVNFNVTLTGFKGKRVEVRWSLYSARRQRPVPREWLRNRRALRLRGKAKKGTASREFWVPVPEVKGPFFIRVGVHDRDGGRLDYADTPRFR